MKNVVRLFVAAVAVVTSLSGVANGNEQNQILIKNVNVFDGKKDSLIENVDVLVEGNLIAKVGRDTGAHTNATLIDGKGMTLIPGLIDMHAHFCIQEGMLAGRDAYDQMAMGARAHQSMLQYLDQGFTTARDAGCNILGLAKAINNGLLEGPRLYPSGGFLSQTGGHADTGSFNDVPGRVDDLERHSFGYIVDGGTEARRAARQNLRAGATQIKIMAGGGVASEFDPIHTTQFSEEEMRAIVEVAEDYGTYVMAHAYHDRSVNRAIDAGVKVIEHNFLVSEKTIKRMKKEGVALSAQAVMSLEAFAEPESITFFSPDQKAKAASVNKGATQMFQWARKHDLLIVTGGDMFGPAYNLRQADNMVWMSKVGFSPFQIMKMGTSSAAEVLSWSGGMNPYKYGKLGVIEPGAYADLILVDGNPLEQIAILNDYTDKFKVIMKDGKIHKNSL
ncbi:amidohydrolase family protein [Ferrimonas sp. SCSIO 43195]|uniref:metal-dependent hydrolase family protein n=1 Tax=Ferrimonas sp. SCSIO 43195 TaxID=2822844 RepID=UPI0020762125|nr:amidohydrolase family protein [Ferrimonas sp. SCSIO 43195]USD37012.1 amidohydrolase family protein [Ferrimonas sp. SCSIO 43195]